MAARFRAKLAVGVGGRVPRAFFKTELAGDNAGVQLRMNEIVRRIGLPEEKPGGRCANVRTIEVGGDASPQHFDVAVFGETRVSADGAGFGAGGEGSERVGVILRARFVSAWMTAEQGFGVRFHVGTTRSAAKRAAERGKKG